MAREDRWDVLLTGPIDDAGREAIADIAAFTAADSYPDREALVADVDRFEAIIHRSFEIDATLVDRASSLRVIAKHGVGVDEIDVEAATRNGVVVCNTPGANARAVAEHSLALLLSVRNRLRPADADLRAGEWERERYAVHELGGRTLGVFGFGNVGRRVADVARGIGMDVVAYDPYVDAAEYPDGVGKVGERELYERSELLSVHAPLTDETRGAIGADELAALPDDAVVVTAARGGVVDEDALVAALDADELAGAGVDVFEEEPPGEDHPLFAFENVVVTPHIAGTTHEAAVAMAVGAAEHVRTVYEGGVPETALNPEAVE